MNVVATAPRPGSKHSQSPFGRLNFLGQLWIIRSLFAHFKVSGDTICWRAA